MERIKRALVSVYHKEGLDEILRLLHNQGVTLVSTGGTAEFIEQLGIPVEKVEDITQYPSILGGRVKTLHPQIFGGILSRKTAEDRAELQPYNISEIDLAIVDLYPFEETVQSGATHAEIVEKIDIGGISLIRAAAKNYAHVLIIPERSAYKEFKDWIQEHGAKSNEDFRKKMAIRAFDVSSHYDTMIYSYLCGGEHQGVKISIRQFQALRYGENPHQKGFFAGKMGEIMQVLCGKELSYNNLIDIDAAIHLMSDFKTEAPTIAILKHNNSCGLATRQTLEEAWKAALAGDPVSAFGGVLISNRKIEKTTAEAIDQLFYEVLIAPDFDSDAFHLLSARKNRILIRLTKWPEKGVMCRSLLNGMIVQDQDTYVPNVQDLKLCTKKPASPAEIEDLLYASKCVKHLKSNSIALVKNKQLIGMGCGQTSRVDALNHAIHKSRQYGFDLRGSVMASEAFFPFPDCVQIAYEAGITAVVQPGGSIKDTDSITFCDQMGMSMYLTGIRHFKH